MAVSILPFCAQYPLRTVERGGVRVHLVGNLHDVVDPMATVFAAMVHGDVLRDEAALRTALHALYGNFALVVVDRLGAVLASTDKIKSFPIAYVQDGGTVHIAASASDLRACVPAREHPSALLEFAMAGYVTNGETLHANIRQLRGGEYLLVDQGGHLRTGTYYQFLNPTVRSLSRRELVDALRVTTEGIFERLVRRLNGRTVLVPLSGGYDSRLIITMLREFGCERVRTFSYGVPGNCEARAASVVAERLGVPWMFIPYTRKFGRAVFQTAEREQYFAFAHQLSGIPMMTDFYAFYELVQHRRIPSDSVVINGQTGDFISGGHIPAAINAPAVDRRTWLDAILAKHYALWTNLCTPDRLAIIRERILRSMPAPVPDTLTREDAMKQYECWEWRARQCEHVVAGQRVYDFFGLAWELPLWDDAYLAFWSSVSFDAKFRQSLYLETLRTFDRFGVFQRPFRRYTPPRSLAVVSACLGVLGPRADVIRRRYLQYWQKYAYFYAIYPYREYVRFARAHRNPSSCLAKEILEHEYRCSPCGTFALRAPTAECVVQ